MSDQIMLHSSLKGHDGPVNALAFSPEGDKLLSGDDLGTIHLWSISQGQQVQTIHRPFSGQITCITWISYSVATETDTIFKGFAFGTGQGMIEVYKFNGTEYVFSKAIQAHNGPVDAIAFDPHHHRLASSGAGYPQVWSLNQQVYLQSKGPTTPVEEPKICKSIHFVDKGEALVAIYLENHAVEKYHINPWEHCWTNFTQCRNGASCLDGDSLYITNLHDGIDVYSLRSLELIKNFKQLVKENILLQIDFVHDGNWIVAGGDNGSAHVYKRQTGVLVQELPHKEGGRVQTIASCDLSNMSYIATASTNVGKRSIINIWSISTMSTRTMKEGVDNVGSTPAQTTVEDVANPLERRQYILILIIALLLVTLLVTNTAVGHWMKQLAGRFGSVLSSFADVPVSETNPVTVRHDLSVITVDT